MRPIVTVLLSLAIAALAPSVAVAQAAPRYVEVELRDGSKLYGTITTDEPARIVVRTIAGPEVNLERAQIKRINQTAGEVVGGEFWTDDVVASKLFLGPTGRSLKRGQGYFAIDSLFLPVFQVGVTDRFSVGMGVPFYGFVGTAWITPKLQIYQDEKTAISTGVLHLFVRDFGLGGYGYVAATRGTPNAAITVSGGMLYGRDEGKRAATPMFSVGGEKRLGRRTKLVTENYFFSGGAIVSVGTRIVGQEISTELGAMVPIIPDSMNFPGIFFNFVFHGRPRR